MSTKRNNVNKKTAEYPLFFVRIKPFFFFHDSIKEEHIDFEHHMKQSQKFTKQHGAALLLTVFFFVVVSIVILLSTSTGAMSELRTYRTLVNSKYAYTASEGAGEDILYRIITNKQLPATETLALNNATGSITIFSVSPTLKDLYARGDAGAQVRKLYMEVSQSANAAFLYGAQVGKGGIIMDNNSYIVGTGLAQGDVYSNGKVTGSPGASITGSVSVSTGIVPDATASSTTCISDEVVGRTNPNIDYAQSFVMSGTTTDSLAKVSLYLKRNGSPSALNVRITADNGGKPATTALATQPLSYVLVGTSYGWVDVNFTNPPLLSPGTTYWIVLDASQNNSKYWYWCRSAVDEYSGGFPLYKLDWSTSGAWSAVLGDLNFRTYFGKGVSQVDSVSVTGTVKADVIGNTSVGGDAYYQTITSSTVAGTSYPGSPTPPPVSLPISNTTLAQWKSDAAAGGVINGNCGTGGISACNTFPLTLGPKKINGNLVVDNGGVLTISGTVYVSGFVDISNNGTVRCSTAYLGKSCVLIADGYISASNNALFFGSGTPGSFVLLLTTIKNCTGAGSTGVGCAANQSGIEIANNATGALFYASDSLVDISNNAMITAVVAYMLHLSNNTSIVYDSSVASMSFTSNPASSSSSWSMNRWSEL